MNGTDGVASHSFCFKHLSLNCTFRLSKWRSVVGNLQFFDPQVATYFGINKDLFRERENKVFFLFFDCRCVFAAYSVFNILGYWLR